MLFLPRFDAPQARLFGPDWMGLDLPRHLYHFEPRTFAATAQRAGLRVVATEPYSRRHSPAFWTASLFPGLQKQRLNLLARREPGRAAAGKAAFAALTAAARPLARAEAALGFEPQRSYFLVAALRTRRRWAGRRRPSRPAQRRLRPSAAAGPGAASGAQRRVRRQRRARGQRRLRAQSTPPSSVPPPIPAPPPSPAPCRGA